MPEMKYYSIWISILIVIVFMLQYIPGFESLFILKKSAFLEIWRYVTSIFLHSSFAHLIFNLFALLVFGLILEKTIGSNKFLLIFFASGILANIVAVNFYSQSLGASGAIFGIIGALVIVKPMMGVFLFGMIVPMFIAAVIWVLIDVIGLFVPDNTGHIAHLSGIIFGIIFGILFRLNHENIRRRHKIEIPEHLLRKWEILYMKNN